VHSEFRWPGLAHAAAAAGKSLAFRYTRRHEAKSLVAGSMMNILNGGAQLCTLRSIFKNSYAAPAAAPTFSEALRMQRGGFFMRSNLF